MKMFYAHSSDGRPPDDWHLLEEHLKGTAELAKSFAEEFGSGEWAYLAGLWHDLGKYSDAFQKMLLASVDAHIETKSGRVDHSTAGAIHSVEKFNIPGRIFSYLIAGHHAGLTDWQTAEAGNRSLIHRLQNDDLLKKTLESNIPQEITEQFLPRQKFRTIEGHALWIRMLYSCLVDADFLDTEAFLDPDKSKTRKDYPSLNELQPLFETYMDMKQAGADDTDVNKQRADILRQCLAKSLHEPAIFTLTVPTGGGKTLSSMAFALHHAAKYSKRRIIYVIPYTSIIEQTADQFRELFKDAVVEHHSNVDVSDEGHETTKSRLACENWDAPVIVTTSVQFFESLFANRSSRCRKLHNITNSVVVLDEVQLLPPEYLNPILHTMKELRNNYGVTFVLSTATQPAFGEHKSFDYNFEGLGATVEIMENPVALHKTLKRVEIHVPDDLLTSRSWEDLAKELAQQSSVLCIVNRRDDCRTLYELMPEGTSHLSALMCGAHRSKVISQIKQRLKDKLPTRVISTQLVEAGVDLDFPVVYRAIAGLDSIAQAAGGVLEAILWKPAIRWKVTQIDALKPIKWESVRRNEVGAVMSSRTNGLFIEEQRQQRAGLLLRDVAYTIHAYFEMSDKAGEEDTVVKFQEMFLRRAEKGQCFHRPYLGCREFAAEFEVFTNGKPLPEPISETRDLGWMLYDIDFNCKEPMPRFFRASLDNGRMMIDGVERPKAHEESVPIAA